MAIATFIQLRESTIRADASTVPDELVDLHARLGLVGLTTYEDRAYCHEHARTIYRGEGQIVELGCWLGSLTSALALGLEENPAPAAHDKLVHAHDRFVWTEWMDTLPLELNPDGLRAGERFPDSFEARVELWRERIAIHEGDLLQLGWQGGPIEFLVVDAMKSWELTGAIARHFLPAARPGHELRLPAGLRPRGSPLDSAAHLSVTPLLRARPRRHRLRRTRLPARAPAHSALARRGGDVGGCRPGRARSRIRVLARARLAGQAPRARGGAGQRPSEVLRP